MDNAKYIQGRGSNPGHHQKKKIPILFSIFTIKNVSRPNLLNHNYFYYFDIQIE